MKKLKNIIAYNAIFDVDAYRLVLNKLELPKEGLFLDILRVLAIQRFPLDIKEMSIFFGINFKKEGSALLKQINRFSEQDIVSVRKDYYGHVIEINPLLSAPLLLDFWQKDPDGFIKIANNIRQSRFGDNLYEQESEQRHFLLNLCSNNINSIHENKKRIDLELEEDEFQCDARVFPEQRLRFARVGLHWIFNSKLGAKFLESMPEGTYNYLFHSTVYLPTIRGLPCQSSLNIFEKKLFDKGKPCSVNNSFYAEVLFFKGRFDEIEKISNLSEKMKLSYSGIKAYFAGDHKRVEETFRVITKTYTKQMGGNYAIKDIFDVIHLVVWALSDKTSDKGFKSILKSSILTNETSSFAPLRFLPQLIEGSIKETNKVIDSWQDKYFDVYQLKDGLDFSMGERLHSIDYYQWDYSFHLIFLLVQRWFYPNLFNTQKDRILFCFENNFNAGNDWYAFEFGTLLLELDPKSKHKKMIEELTAKLKIPSLSSLRKKSLEWELNLNALLTLSGKGNQTTKNRKRLAWFFNKDFTELNPKAQTLKKSGWDSQSIDVRGLAKRKPDYLSSLDLKLLEIAKPEDDYYYYHPYEFFTAPCLLALIGHPHVFDPKGAKVEIEKADLCIEIRQQDQGYNISFNKENLDHDFYYNKSGPNRLEVYPLTKKIHEIYQILGPSGLLVPEEGKDNVIRVLKNLSTEIPIQSDMEGDFFGQLKKIEAPSELLLHLQPYADGLKLEAYISPFSRVEKEDAIDQFLVKVGQGKEQLISQINGERTLATRDLAQEKKNLADLKTLLPMLEGSQLDDDAWSIDHLESSLELIEAISELDERYRVAWPKGETLKVAEKATSKQLSLSISGGADWFSVDGKLQLNDENVYSLKQLLGLLKLSNSRFIPITQDRYLSISKELKKKLDNINGLCFDKGDEKVLSPLLASSLEESLDGLKEMELSDEWKSQLKSAKEATKHTPKLPSTLEAELRPYQLDGFKWLSRLSKWGVGACLSDDMGLGKTIQAITLFLERCKSGPALVVAPVSVCENWQNEITRFAPSLNPIQLADGVINKKNKSSREKIIKKLGKFDVLLCSYGLLQQEIDSLETCPFSTIVLDEAQAIKNFNTKRNKAAMRLKGDFKMVATGTPVENNLMDLWSLFRFLNPGLLGSQQDFMNKYFYPIHKAKDPKAQEFLRQTVQPFILRRLKRDVLKELPEKTEINRFVELSEKEKEFYESVRQVGVENIENSDEDGGHRALKVLAEITRLRRACCHPDLIAPELKIPSAKLAEFDLIVDELIANNHKALVFSQFVGYLKIIEAHLKAKGVSYQYLDGSTPGKKRQKIVDEFQSGNGELFLISLKAGGSGLNLTAASYVIHMDPWWNPAVEDQASDRAHRIGQKQAVTVYRIISKDTIEEKILQLHDSKRDIADKLLEGADVSAKLNPEDLLNLMKENL